MGGYLKQSTAATVKLGPFVDDADGKTAETALSIAQADIRLTKNGGDCGQTNNVAGATHDENGYYDVPLDTTDTGTVGRLRVMVSKSGALPVWDDFTVLDTKIYDSLIGATDNLEVDLVQIGGGAQSATDLKDFADTGYDPSPHKVTGVVLTDTVTTYTGNTPQTGDAYAVVKSGGAGDAAAIKTQTDKLNFAGTDVKATLDSEKVDLVDAPNATAVTAIQNGLATASAVTTIDTVVDGIASAVTTVDGIVDAIKAKTDNLPASPAATGDIPTAAAVADAVWDEALAGHAGAGSTGAGLSAASSAGDPWATLIPGAYGAGTAGKIVGDNLNAPVGTVDTVVDAIKAKTDNLPATPAASGDVPTAAAVADAVWDEAIAGHTDSGKTGAALQAASSAGDPWATTLPGGYGAGTAGKLLSDNLNAPVATVDTVVDAIKTQTDKLSFTGSDVKATLDGETVTVGTNNDKAGYSLSVAPPTAAQIRAEIDANSTKLDVAVSTRNATAPDNASIAAIKAKTDNLPAAPAGTGDIPAATAVADAVLARNLAGGSNGGRMVKDALRLLRNKAKTESGTLTVYQEDDTTEAWTATLTADATAEPIITVDPA